MAKNPQFAVYKKAGAIKMEVTGANLEKTDKYGTVEKGFAMLEMCPATGKFDDRGNPTYNWKDDKIVFKCSDKDLADIYLALVHNAEKTIVHDPNAGTGEAKKIKKLKLSPGKTSGIFIEISFEDQKVSVPLDDNEIMRLRILLPTAIQSMYGWFRLG
jgi:hypothetical protein